MNAITPSHIEQIAAFLRTANACNDSVERQCSDAFCFTQQTRIALAEIEALLLELPQAVDQNESIYEVDLEQERARWTDSVDDRGPDNAPAPVGRCPQWKAMRRFYAIARERGLDTRKEAHAAMREALSILFNFTVLSRKTLTAEQWVYAGDALKIGNLTWTVSQ